MVAQGKHGWRLASRIREHSRAPETIRHGELSGISSAVGHQRGLADRPFAGQPCGCEKLFVNSRFVIR